MINVMKAQKYQVLRSISTYAVALVALVLFCAVVFSDVLSDDTDKLSASLFTSYIGEINVTIMPILILIYTGLICGSDLSDKTINYELLSGVKRRDVFFGRFFVVLIVNVILYIIFAVLPILIFALVFGWGHTMTVHDVVLRYVTGLFPLIRFTAFYALIAFIVRSTAGVIALGYILSMVEMLSVVLLNELFNMKVTMYLFTYDIFNRILAPQNMGYGFFDGEDVMVVKDILEKETILHASAAGMIGTAVFLIISYVVIRRRDMN